MALDGNQHKTFVTVTSTDCFKTSLSAELLLEELTGDFVNSFHIII